MLCPSLKEIVLYSRSWDDVEDLVSMARTRALVGAKLSSVTLITLGTSAQGIEASGLEDHVTHVEYRENGVLPAWDYLPDESESWVGA